MMYKKAQDLSMTTIVVAALALIVLVVLALVFTGRIGVFAGRSGDCVTLGGTCATDTVGCGDLQSHESKYDNSCNDEKNTNVPYIGKICCLGVK